MIEARGLSKYYGPFVAIEDVSFSIPEGQIAAFLGPNGAGKSTTMKILTGYLARQRRQRGHRRPRRPEPPPRGRPGASATSRRTARSTPR